MSFFLNSVYVFDSENKVIRRKVAVSLITREKYICIYKGWGVYQPSRTTRMQHNINFKRNLTGLN